MVRTGNGNGHLNGRCHNDKAEYNGNSGKYFALNRKTLHFDHLFPSQRMKAEMISNTIIPAKATVVTIIAVVIGSEAIP